MGQADAMSVRTAPAHRSGRSGAHPVRALRCDRTDCRKEQSERRFLTSLARKRWSYVLDPLRQNRDVENPFGVVIVKIRFNTRFT